MKALLVAVLLLLPGLVSAQPFPALHDVAGVAADDVLNVRAGPTASAEIIGTLAPDAAGIEVIGLSDGGNWGQVNTSETSGWVSMAYMARRPGQDWGDVPEALSCFGTEPFWSFDVASDGTAHFSSPETGQSYKITERLSGQGTYGKLAIIAETPFARATALVSTTACSDGMSDRAYGLDIGLLLDEYGQNRFYSGCCSLAD
jgi:uncharacterized membrane protein